MVIGWWLIILQHFIILVVLSPFLGKSSVMALPFVLWIPEQARE